MVGHLCTWRRWVDNSISLECCLSTMRIAVTEITLGRRPLCTRRHVNISTACAYYRARISTRAPLLARPRCTWHRVGISMLCDSYWNVVRMFMHATMSARLRCTWHPVDMSKLYDFYWNMARILLCGTY